MSDEYYLAGLENKVAFDYDSERLFAEGFCPTCGNALLLTQRTVGPGEVPSEGLGCPPCNFEDWMMGPITIGESP